MGLEKPAASPAVEYSVILLPVFFRMEALSAPRIRRSMITRLGILVLVSAQR